MIITVINDLLSFTGIRLRKITDRKQIESLWIKMTPYDSSVKLKRVGGNADGGYVVAELDVRPDLVISPGVGDKSDFELHYAGRGIKCVLIDGSVVEPSVTHPLFKFINRHLGVISNSEFISIQEIADTYSYSNAILQMDIEGAEYETLNYLNSQDLSRFSMIVVEIHGLSRMLDPDVGYLQVRQLIETLTELHVPVHAHPNNIGGYFKCYGTNFPNIVELTLVRRNLAGIIGGRIQPNRELDVPNSMKYPDLPFPILKGASILE